MTALAGCPIVFAFAVGVERGVGRPAIGVDASHRCCTEVSSKPTCQCYCALCMQLQILRRIQLLMSVARVDLMCYSKLQVDAPQRGPWVKDAEILRGESFAADLQKRRRCYWCTLRVVHGAACMLDHVGVLG